MPKGYSAEVAARLWRIVELLREGEGLTADDLSGRLDVGVRVVQLDIARLRAMGVHVRSERKGGRYRVQWPRAMPPLVLGGRESLLAQYALCHMAAEDPDAAAVAGRINLMLHGDTQAVFERGTSYGAENPVTARLLPLFQDLKGAIVERRKVVLRYGAPGKEPAMRVVHPHKLIHTPVSWYLVAWCEEAQGFRNFKLARIAEAKVLADGFEPLDFDVRAWLGDAWWLQKGDGPPRRVSVLFTGEAAQAIREYAFHPTQRDEPAEGGTRVTWELSHLEEFATWLLQWLGQFRVEEPADLAESIAGRLARHAELAAAPAARPPAG